MDYVWNVSRFVFNESSTTAWRVNMTIQEVDLANHLSKYNVMSHNYKITQERQER